MDQYKRMQGVLIFYYFLHNFRTFDYAMNINRAPLDLVPPRHHI